MVNLTRIYNRALNTNEIQLLYLEWLKKLWPANLWGFPNLLSNLVYYADFKWTAHNLVDWVNWTVSWATLTTDRFWYTNSAYSFSWWSNRIAVTWINSWIWWSFTYSFWYKPSSVTSAQLFLYDWWWSSRNIYFEFTAWWVMNFFRWNWASSQDTALSYNPWFSVWTYYHITITQSWTAKAMYVNWVSVATQTSTLSWWTTANTVYISSSNWVDTWVQWVIDESILMNKALSASEVSTLYKLTSSDYIYPNPSYDLLSLREWLVLDLNEQGKDLSGNWYNWTITWSPVILRQGKAKWLNHTTSTYINFGNILNYEWNQPFTKTFWHKFTDAWAYKQLIGKQNNSAPNQWSWIEVNWWKYWCWLYYTTPNSNVKETTTTYNDGIMRMVTFTRDWSWLASWMKLYINWNIDNSFVSKSPYVWPATWWSLLTTQWLQINWRWNSTDSTHTWTIVNPRIRNRALTAREVQALYYSQKWNYIY